MMTARRAATGAVNVNAKAGNDVMKRMLAMVGVVVLAGCGSGNPGAPPQAKAQPRADVAAMVASIREVGAQGVELEVRPLRDPQVEDLRLRAEAEEAAGELGAAVASLDLALMLVPGDPDLLQWKAELSLLRRAWSKAETLAHQSYENGPRLGGLCRRNWATIQQARLLGGNAEGAEVARRQVESCTVAPPVRM